MATILTPDQIERLDALELFRLEPGGDPWKAAWEAVDLAGAIARANLKDCPAEALGAVWVLLTVAEACDRWLEEQGRTSADDNGDTASRRVRKLMGSLAGRSLRRAVNAD